MTLVLYSNKLNSLILLTFVPQGCFIENVPSKYDLTQLMIDSEVVLVGIL